MQAKQYDFKVSFLCLGLLGGGSERVSLTVARQFASRGIRSSFISNEYKKEEFVLPKGFEAEVVLLPDTSQFFSPSNVEALVQYLVREEVRILFFVYLDGDILDELRKRVPQCRFVYWLHVSPFWEKTQQKELGEMRAKYSLKYWFRWHILGHKKHILDIETRLRKKYCEDLENFDAYIALCPEYKDELVESLNLKGSKLERKIFPILNTIDMVEQTPSSKKKEIVWVGRISLVQKRFDWLFELWKRVEHRLPDWTLKVHGSGPDLWIYEKMERKYGFERMQYQGFGTDLAKMYSEASVLLLTSSFEGWGMVISEGQSYGVVPMAFDCSSGVRHLLNNGKAGILVEPFDLDKYADELVALCNDELRLAELRETVREQSKNFAHHVNDECWDELFSSLGLSPIS